MALELLLAAVGGFALYGLCSWAADMKDALIDLYRNLTARL